MSKIIELKGFLSEDAKKAAEETEGHEVPLVIMGRAVNISCSDIVFRTPQSGDSINENELISIKALLAWAAVKNDLDETTITEQLKSYLGVKRIEAIPSARYDDAVKYLVDFELVGNRQEIPEIG